jgi:hypothetical protein
VFSLVIVVCGLASAVSDGDFSSYEGCDVTYAATYATRVECETADIKDMLPSLPPDKRALLLLRCHWGGRMNMRPHPAVGAHRLEPCPTIGSTDTIPDRSLKLNDAGRVVGPGEVAHAVGARCCLSLAQDASRIAFASGPNSRWRGTRFFLLT